MNNEKKFNLIGFNFPRPGEHPEEYRTCLIHPGYRLIPKQDEPGMLWCPKCGTPYPENEALKDEKMKGKFSKQTKIISAKKKKKYYDKQGNEINDETLLKDIARGATVYSYHEEKSGKEEKRHIVRK